MIDILTLDPTDEDAIGELIDLLRAHCSPDQCEQFLVDLRRWERRLGKDGRALVERYRRMVARGAFDPPIVRAMAKLEASEQWREVMMWQAFIASLSAPARQEAA